MLAVFDFLQINDHVGKRQLLNRHIGTKLDCRIKWNNFTFKWHCSPSMLYTFDIDSYFQYDSEITTLFAIHFVRSQMCQLILKCSISELKQMTYGLLSDNESHFHTRWRNSLLPLQSSKSFKSRQLIIYNPWLIDFIVNVSVLRKSVNCFSL